MLVMKMTRGQRVMIGNVTIYIAALGDSTVRMNIDADREIPIVREEAIEPLPQSTAEEGGE